MRILVVEDEPDLNNIITKYLKKNGYGVDSVFDGEEALDYLRSCTYDLVILDIMLPKLDGYQVAKKLRDEKNNTLILMLTAKDDIEDKVKGLDTADDYLVKPFDFKELLARVRALIRRRYRNISSEIIVGDVVLNTTEKSVRCNGQEINLTGKEYEILEYLMQNKGRVLSREKIRNHVWNFEYDGESNVIDVIIKNIRKKLNLEGTKSIIQTKRGLGYVVKDEE